MPGTGAGASYGDMLVTSLLVLGGVCVAAFLIVRVVGRLLATGRVRGAPGVRRARAPGVGSSQGCEGEDAS